MKSKARQGLDRLLAEYPEAEVGRIWSYEHVESIVYATNSGPWTCVDLLIAPETIVQFAIWNYTGNVYRLDTSGAVEDDPFIVITPLGE
jgi:hypothetical protein